MYTCARLDDGTARCWGSNFSGQLGDGTTTDRLRPVVVSNEAGTGPLTGVAQIAGGYLTTSTYTGSNTCARLNDGTARCWGNGWGLGDGTTTLRTRPVVVANEAGTGPLTGITEITAGDGYACARLDDGTARCWGVNAIGDGTTTVRLRPVVVSNEAGTGPLTGVTDVSAGSYHACAQLNDGTARCWGYNEYGALGDGTTTHRTRPVVVSNEAGTGPLTGVAEITAGGYRTCARLNDGTARCWGSNPLGDGTRTNRTRPVVVLSSDPVASVPGTPAGLTATPGDGRVALSWTPPASDGGSPITAYRVYRSGALVHTTANGSTTSFTDTGVTNGRYVDYSVRAMNAAGEGPQSLTVPVTPAPPVADAPVWHKPSGGSGQVALLAGSEGRVPANVGTRAQTGGRASGYDADSWGGESRIIPPADDRVNQASTTGFPNSAIVAVRTSVSDVCTGWMASANVVITAAHCIYNFGRWADEVTVTPGRNGTAAPFGNCGAKKLWTVAGWVSTAQGDPGDADLTRDYGAIKLDCDIGRRTGWLGFYSTTNSFTSTRTTTLRGYPFDRVARNLVGNRVFPLQVKSPGSSRLATSSELFYDNDIATGMSGSPVITSSGCGTASCVAGIATHDHSLGFPAPLGVLNGGPRITASVFSNLVYWRGCPAAC